MAAIVLGIVLVLFLAFFAAALLLGGRASSGGQGTATLPAWEGHSQEMVCVQWLDDHALQVTAYDLTAMQSGAADASITWTCTLAG